MKDLFIDLFNKKPVEIIDNDYYFNSDSDGDPFEETEVEFWLKDGVFKNNWERAAQNNNENLKNMYADVCDIFEKNPYPFLEIACGPGMGLTPIILSKHPKLSCLVTDACSYIIKAWRKYINQNLKQYNINLASFSVFDMPIKSNSIDIVTSAIGVSSTRAGEQGEIQAIREIFRLLKKGGYFIAIESEWIDFDAIEKVFALWGRPVWDSFGKEKTWHEKFLECGFNIESCDKSNFRYLRKDDNDLGEQADKFGINIGKKSTLFILRKPN